MDIQCLFPAQTPLPPQWQALLNKTGLHVEDIPEVTVLVFDGETLAATGSRSGSLIKYLAVDPVYQGEDLTATVLTALRRSAFDDGCRHLFLYTKPANRHLLQQLFFYPVVQAGGVLLMEDQKDGLKQFLASLPRRCVTGRTGALVMNCDPFTRGHQYVIEQAARACDLVYVFVLSEERSHFPAADRLALVRAGTAHLPQVCVLPSGPYMVSSATFPTYFLPDRDKAQAHCALDAELFGRHIAPALGITCRYVGSEPFSALTASYNRTLQALLPPLGIQVCEIPRLAQDGQAISASRVRHLLYAGDLAAAEPLIPPSTYRYLLEHQQEG